MCLCLQGRLPCGCTSKRRCLSKCMLSDSSRWQRESHDSHRCRGLLPFSSWQTGWWHTYRNREIRHQSHSGSGSSHFIRPQNTSLCRFPLVTVHNIIYSLKCNHTQTNTTKLNRLDQNTELNCLEEFMWHGIYVALSRIPRYICKKHCLWYHLPCFWTCAMVEPRHSG